MAWCSALFFPLAVVSALSLSTVRLSAQVINIPEGLITGQAASLVVNQKNFSDITFGLDNEHWGAISGLAIAGNKLIVVDSSYLAPPNNNRVLIYDNLDALRQRKPHDNLPSAAVLIGQPNPNSSSPGTSSTQMFQPSGVATDGTRLFVSEWGNNRVLIYNQIPDADGAAADVVIGQQSFTTNDVGTSASTMRHPNGVATDGTGLFVADTFNNRVLIFDQIPTQNGAAAHVVLGQAGFDTRQRQSPAANTLYDPMSATSDGTRLIVTDFGNNRVLIFNQIPTQNGTAADVVVGQDDFTSSDPGNTATRLNFPRYAYSDGTRLLIVDSGNNRILIYNQIPTQNGAAADIVLGQRDLMGLQESCAASNLAVPFMVASDGQMLYVSDGFNRRILGFRPGENLHLAAVNGASFSTEPQTEGCGVVLLQPPIAPGGISSIFGTNLSETTEQASNLPLPKEMGGVTVWFDGIQAPLYYVSPTQINVQVPFELNGYSASLEVDRSTANGTIRSAPVAVGLADGAPGIFSWDGTGSGPGVITHSDFTPVDDNHPAVPGETLAAFVTGLGSVDEDMTTGAPAEFASKGSVNISGTVSAGQTVTILVNGVAYPYTTSAGDTLSDVVTRLAARIDDSSPVVSASADTGNLDVLLKARQVGDQGVSNTFSASVTEGSGLSASVGGEAVIPATIGFVGTPQPGQTIVVLLQQQTSFAYTTTAGDTTETIVTKLADRINGDPNVSAVANPSAHSIDLALKDPSSGLSISYSISISQPGATIVLYRVGTATVVPGGIEFDGTVSAGQVVSVFLAGTKYSYTTTASDTLESTISALANLINEDPNVAATADLPNRTLNLTLKTSNLSINFNFTVTLADALRLDTGGSSAIPATLTVRGTPMAGQVVTAYLASSRYEYVVQQGDTAESLAAALAGLINADPDVSATADGATINLESAGSQGGLQLDTGGATAVPATITVSGTPRAGQIAAVTLNDTTTYAYVVRKGDTIDDIASALNGQLNGDANVKATLDGTTITLELANEGTSVSLSAELSLPLSTTVTKPNSFEAITSAQHFTPGQGNASNTVSGFIGETLAAVPGDILFFNEPVAGETVTVKLADTPYSYTIEEGDTLADLLTNLAAQVDADPNVTASADATGGRIQLGLRDPTSTAKIGFSVSITGESGELLAATRSSTTTNSEAALVQFAGPVKGFVGLEQVNFTVPSDAPVESNTKVSFSQNLIVFGSVTSTNIYSNIVTFPVAALLQVGTGGATTVPATLTISGSPVVAGELITVTLGDASYSYTVVAGDTLESIAANLAALLDADPSVSASASGASISLQQTNTGTSISLSVKVGFG